MNFEELPLSYAQQRLWFLDQLEPNSPFYNISLALHLAGNLQVDVLEKSLQEIIQRHEALRTNFATVEGNPVQVIKPESNWQLTLVNGKDSPKYREEQEIKKWLETHSHQPFDLANDSLIRATLLQLSDTEHFLLICLHHIVSDGWSMGVFIEELTTLYHAYTKGLEPLLPELPIQYADFAIWQREYLQGEIRQNQLNYWQKQLAAAPALLDLPTDYPRPLQQSFQGDRIKCILSPELSQGLNKLSREKGVTLFMTLLTAFQTLLYRYTGQTDILVGTPIANRTRSELAGLIGFFVNTLVLRTDLAGNPSFSELLKQVRETATDAYDHQDLPFEMLVEALQPERNMSYTPLFQVMFGLDNEPINEIALEGIKVTRQPLEFKTAKFDLSLSIQVKEARLTAIWEYNTDLFDKSTIERLSGHFVNLLTGIIANPEQTVSQLPLLTESERNQLLFDWNQTETDYKNELCLHQLFEQQVKQNPQVIAVKLEDEFLTYQELNCKANQLAHYLQSLGVKAESLVGIFVERSLDMIIGILGILKAGGAYIPLDIDYPQERIAYLIEDTQLSILLTQSQLLEQLPAFQGTTICLDQDWSIIAKQSKVSPLVEVDQHNLAYIIYTSGSTGQPKGVMIEHRSVVNYILTTIREYGITSEDQVLQFSSICFDASVEEIFGGLLSGATLVLRTEEMLRSSEDFWQCCQKWQLTVLGIPTAYWHQLAAELTLDNLRILSNIKVIFIGGEAIQTAKVQQWQTVTGHYSPLPRLFNGYGPTEATIATTFYQFTSPTITNVPIGRPISNTQIYILDACLQPVPVGVAGELHIGGVGLARGYFNRPELTQEKFIPNSFEKDEVIPPTPLNKGGNEPSKLYKTGDLARYLPDGNIEYVGRIDNQVKIRGFRIELGEIEAVLSQNQAVQSSCVIVREDNPGEKQLVAYIVPKLGVKLTSGDLRQFLSHKLPGYMVPGAFVMLESFPLTANGKIDRRALKAPSNTSDSDRFIEARNQLELNLVQIWSKVLKIDKISVHDNFFDLGGHSLLAPYLITQIKEQLGKEIAVTTIFQNPTIEQLATIIQTDADSSNQSCLVPIQPQGSKPPFFCVPGAGGRPFYFYHLGRYLGKDQPFYSFENDLYQQFGEITRIEDIASIYLKAMQDLQPQGPYFLGGHSYGGNVAFEMAQQLVNQGQQVALLAIIDSSAPTYKDKQILLDYINWDHARWLAEVSKGIEVYLDKTIDISYETLQLLTVEEQLKYALNFFKLANMLPPNAETRQLEKIVQAYKTSCLCLIDYLPKQIYPGKITIIRAGEELADDPNKDLIAGDCEDSSLGWSEFSTEPVEIHFVLGNHVSIMVEPHVQILAEELKVCLEI